MKLYTKNINVPLHLQTDAACKSDFSTIFNNNFN